MKEIATISPERLNNGAHYLFMTSELYYAVADEKKNELEMDKQENGGSFGSRH